MNIKLQALKDILHLEQSKILSKWIYVLQG